MTQIFFNRCLFTLLFIGGSLVSCQDDSSEATLQKDPVIESYSPMESFTGEDVVIVGENFGTKEADVEVYFYDGAVAEINSVTNTSISVVIPNEAYAGPITVKVKSKEVTTESNFTVMQVCWIGDNFFACPRIKPG